MEDFEKKYEYNQINDYIGEGHFATIFKVRLRKTNEEDEENKERAIKIFYLYRIKQQIKNTNESIDSYKKAIKDEIEFMKDIEGPNKDNKNTVHYFEHFEDNNHFIIVMELCDMNLGELIKINKSKNKYFSIEEIYNFLIQLNNSFKIMVAKKIVHRDISLGNILLKYNKEKTKYTVKLSDYGISKQLSNKIIKTTEYKSGTYTTRAPEITEYGKFSLESDLWSLGIIIYTLYFNKSPYSGENSESIIKQIDSVRLEETEDNDLNNLIKGLLVQDPQKRITWNQYFNHPFFKKCLNINNIIYETPNQILIMLKVDKKDISKEINFLDNEYYLENYIRKDFNDHNKEIKELNKEKVELYINGENQKIFKKCFMPDKEGEYKIKIIFKYKINDCKYMFRNCNNIISVDLSSFDSSDVTNMNYMFGKCHYLKEVELSNLITDKVTDMSYMFDKCFNLKQIIFPKSFNTKNVEKMEFMFLSCSNLSDIKFSSNFKTNNVKSMKGMFKKCYNLKNINLANFTSENLTDMGYMFDECTNLERVLFTNKEFKTNQVTNMTYLFHKCYNLKEINLSYFNTENIKFLNYMFSECKQLKEIDLSSFKVKEKVQMTHMFENCTNLQNLDISNFNITKNSDKINNNFDNLTNIQKIKVNHDCIDNIKELFKDIKDKFYCNN